MKVLVACEFSGIVRDAFQARGHQAWSCDLLPSERPNPAHYEGDIADILWNGWDLMIAHPPCTHLSSSGARWFKGKLKQQYQAIKFFECLLNCSAIPRVCVENPIGILSTVIRKPDQIIQPWMFGHEESKLDAWAAQQDHCCCSLHGGVCGYCLQCPTHGKPAPPEDK